MDENTQKPVDIYARVSEVDREQKSGLKREASTEGQIAVCRARLATFGYVVGEVLVDSGRSAWNPAVKRPAWNELMDRVERRVSGGFIVFDLERWTRLPKDAERMIELAVRGVVLLDSQSEYDLTTPNGKKAFRDAINAAAYYSDQLSVRTRRGKRLKAMAGEPNGTTRPFGFEADLVSQREDEAALLRDATTRFLAGDPQTAIIAEWNEKGITTSLGNSWKPVSFSALLKRQRNCGRIIYTDAATGVRSVVGRMPGTPIISEEDFERVIAKYAVRRRGRSVSPIYLCSGIAVCGRCGTPLSGRPAPSYRPHSDGSVYRQYWCGKWTYDGCGKLFVGQRDLDEAARAITIEILSDDRQTDAIEATSRELESEAVRLDLAIADAENVSCALSNRFGCGEITLSRYDLAIHPLGERLARLRAERDALGDITSPRSQRVSREHWQRRWDSAELEGKRALLKMALRGRRLIIASPEPGTSNRYGDVTSRIMIE